MATDNRTQPHELFPDVPETYARVGTAADAAADLPVPQDTYADSGEDTAYAQVALPVVPITDHPSENHHLPAAPAAPQPLPVEQDADFDAADTLEYGEQDPYAGGPNWLRAHIPRGPLTSSDPARRGLSGRIPRRPAKPVREPVAAPAEPLPLKPKPKSESDQTQSAPVQSSKNGKRPLILASAAAATLLAIAAGITLGSSNDEAATATASLPSATATTDVDGAAPAAASWCEPSSVDGQVIGRGPGNRTTGPGVIQAFDYAYYVEHDAAKVASMMLNPNPIGPIQKSIDEAAAANTQHCLTITSTPDSMRFDVELLLRSDSGPEGTVQQHITVAETDSGLKIATLEQEAPA